MHDGSVFVPLASIVVGAVVTLAAVMLADFRARNRERLRDERQYQRTILVQRHQDQWAAWRQFLVLGSRLREPSQAFENIEHRYETDRDRIASARRYAHRQSTELHAALAFAFRDRRLADQVVDAMEVLAASRYGGALAEEAVDEKYQRSQELMLAAIRRTEALLGIDLLYPTSAPEMPSGFGAVQTPQPILTPPVESK